MQLALAAPVQKKNHENSVTKAKQKNTTKEKTRRQTRRVEGRVAIPATSASVSDASISPR